MANPAKYFDRYRETIPDFQEFTDALARDPADHIRLNPDRATFDSIAEALAPLKLTVTPEPWFPELLRVEGKGPKKLGVTLAHALGHYYIQSASSAVSALALNAQPGDGAIDLCAAPGSKTTLIAQKVGDAGFVVANEPSPKRLTSLVANLRRLGLTNVVVTSYAGQHFPLRDQFDRVLVDAPCSGEGTWLGREARPKTMSEGQRNELTQRQKQILERAALLLKPGGELIYSTCTYAPEENEAVVAEAVTRHGLELLPFDLPLPTLPGLTNWEGVDFPPSLALAVRLYPHRFDSEGFFVARMAKSNREG